MMGSEFNSGESDLERPEGGVAESTVTERQVSDLIKQMHVT